MQGILGHEQAIGALHSAMSAGRMHHAWIFHGPAGVGKRTVALALARLLLCHDPQTDLTGSREACGACESCRLLAGEDGAHPDLHVIHKRLAAVSDIATLRSRKQMNIPVDLLRERMIGGYVGSAENRKYFEPVVSRRAALGHGKVFIIDEAELLAREGQNILLKTLEEPPPGTYLILVTTNDNRLLPTIRSRCQRVAFDRLTDEQVRAFLADRPEAAELDGDALDLIVRFAAGSPGRALMAAEYDLQGWVSRVEPAMRDLASGRPDPLLGQAMGKLVDDYAERWVKANAGASKEAANKAGVRLMLSMLGELARKAIRHYAAKAGEDRSSGDARVRPWLEAIETIDAAERDLESNVAPPLLLDNLAVQWTRAVMVAGGAKGW